MPVDQLSLYKKVNQELSEEVEIRAENPVFSYSNFDDEEVVSEVTIEMGNEFNVNEMFSSWSPIDNELTIEQNFIFNHPKKLFGDTGVTSEKNKLGLAVHYYSRTSNFQVTEHVGDIENKDAKQILTFYKKFPPSFLRGTIYFEFYIYLKEIEEKLPFQADFIGTNLSEERIDAYSVLIDGDGSVFPIEEISEDGEPLWKLVMNWTDVEEDLFDYSNVRLLLNKSHPLYSYLFNEKYKANQYLLNEIMITAMTMIVQKAILIDKEPINGDSSYSPGSIAQVIWYWISTFELELDSLEKISESFHRKADRFIKG